MDFLKTLENNSILVIPHNIKDKVLEYFDGLDGLVNVKLTDFNQLKKDLLFDYNNETIYKIMDKKNYSYDTAKDFVENLYYLDNEEYIGKLGKLAELKKMLITEGLLTKNEINTNLIKSKSRVYVYGYDHITKLEYHLLEMIEDLGVPYHIEPKENKKYVHEALKLKKLENEIQYVAEKIAKLIKDGVPLDHIYIANYSDEYYFAINKIFKLYGIPFYLGESITLLDTAMGQYFLDHLDLGKEKLLQDIKDKYDMENRTNTRVYNKLFNLVNDCYWTDSLTEIKDLIEAEMRYKNVEKTHYKNEIKNINIIDNIINDDEYVFLLNFNMGHIPRTYKDEDYIEDKIKLPLMEKTEDKNKASKESYIKAIGNIKNLTITYNEVQGNSKLFPSTLLDGINVKESTEEVKEYSMYSSAYNKLLYASRLDDLIKFNDYKDDLELLHNSYKIDYNKYDNSFTGIDTNKIKQKLINKGYSYSSVSKYYECPFKFYLGTFFNLSKYESSFYTFVGSAFHKVLQDCLYDDSKIDDVYNDYVEKHKHELPYGAKEEYFIKSLKDELLFIVKAIREQTNNFNKTDEWHEKPIIKSTNELELNTLIETTINGIVDKCIFVNNNVYIVDYKTGTSAHIARKYFDQGVTIQLPIYLLLLKAVNKDYNIAGMYLQHILEGLVRKSNNYSYEDNKLHRLKLDGITTADNTVVNSDINCTNKSDLLIGYKPYDVDAEKQSDRLITDAEKEELYDTIKDLLETCINLTVEGKYDINPINIKNVVDACEYCSYKDICYLRLGQYKRIKTEDDDKEGDADE